LTKIKARCLTGAAITALCLWSATAQAANEQGQFAVRGVGIMDCATFTKEYKERSQAAFIFAGWLDGYISAANRLQPGTFDAAPWQLTDILMVLINNHCAANPDHRLFSVVQRLLAFYSEQRLANSSDRIDAKVGDKTISVYKEVMRRAQLALAKAGVYSGTADGLFGPRTQAAFEAFQEKSNLAKTGLPDQQTLFRLFEIKQGATQ